LWSAKSFLFVAFIKGIGKLGGTLNHFYHKMLCTIKLDCLVKKAYTKRAFNVNISKEFLVNLFDDSSSAVFFYRFFAVKSPKKETT
jgi:hypothetical protein